MKTIFLIIAFAATGAAIACDETSSKTEVAGEKPSREAIGAFVRRADKALDNCTTRQRVAVLGEHDQMLEDAFNGNVSISQVKEHAEKMEAYCG